MVAPRLENFLRRYLRQTPQVEDIVQQTFLQMHQARGTFIAGAPVLPWAFAIARRLTIDGARRRHSHEHLEIAQDERFSLAELSANTASDGRTLTAPAHNAAL